MSANAERSARQVRFVENQLTNMLSALTLALGTGRAAAVFITAALNVIARLRLQAPNPARFDQLMTNARNNAEQMAQAG